MGTKQLSYFSFIFTERAGNIFYLNLQAVGSLNFHKKNTHADKEKLDFQCEMCGFATYAKRYLQEHLRKVHRGEEQYKHICEHCGKRFLYPFDLNKHHVPNHFIAKSRTSTNLGAIMVTVHFTPDISIPIFHHLLFNHEHFND